MNGKNQTVTVVIDGKPCEVGPDLTILEAAERNGHYIPTLCTHKDLSPFGACRMCIVEVEGAKGFPTACTTPVQNGMVVKTDSDSIAELRREVLRLTLSQHPCGCLVCDEGDDCAGHSGTTRKAGVTTGCRTCPNDGRCDLQEVAKRIGLTRVDYPVYYRDLSVEKYDPFYDRDYNLCILCGRCVRICQDVRGGDALAFQRRGGRTIIGPAFGRTHLESGCEFCGDCVSVCPTGALSEKVRKWDGKPDREEVTTCPLCGLGCRVKILVKDGRVIGSLRADDTAGSGELCVKGRFCLVEIVNDHRRLKKPFARSGKATVEIPWDKAVELSAEKLAGCAPGKFAMIVSPDSSNEDLYIAQKFTRLVMRSNNVDTSARLHYGSGFRAYLDLMKNGARLSNIRGADVILSVGLDARFERSTVGVELRRAVKRGAKIVTLHPRGHSLALVAHEWLRPAPDLDGGYFESFLEAVSSASGARNGPASGNEKASRAARGTRSVTNGNGDFSHAARLLGDAAAPLVLVGPDVLNYEHSGRLLEIIGELARAVGARVLVLPAENNLFGSILMGAYPEILPGGFASSDRKKAGEIEKIWRTNLPDLAHGWTSEDLEADAGLDIIYLIGEVPRKEKSPAEFVIFQNAFPPVALGHADLVLPSAVFAETNGTYVSGEGRIQRVNKAVDPPGEAIPDWEILCRIARKMGVGGFDFENVREVQEEISKLVPAFGDLDAHDRENLSLPDECRIETAKTTRAVIVEQPDPTLESAGALAASSGISIEEYSFVLTAARQENTYRGFALSSWVGGARDIFPDGCVDMNPDDAARTGVEDGDEIMVRSAAFERKWRVRITADQAEGSLRVTLAPGEWLGPNPHRVSMRRSDVYRSREADDRAERSSPGG